MDMLQQLHRLFAYDDWANREALASLKAISSPPPRSLSFIGYIVAAEWLWLGRLKQDKKAVVVWPELSLDQCEGRIADLQQAWQEYLKALTPTQLSQRIAYTNTNGNDMGADPSVPWYRVKGGAKHFRLWIRGRP
jgi:hypothetical protein